MGDLSLDFRKVALSLNVHDAEADEYEKLASMYVEESGETTRWLRIRMGSLEVVVFRPEDRS